MVWGAHLRPTCSKMKGHTWPFTNQKEKNINKGHSAFVPKRVQPFKKIKKKGDRCVIFKRAREPLFVIFSESREESFQKVLLIFHLETPIYKDSTVETQIRLQKCDPRVRIYVLTVCFEVLCYLELEKNLPISSGTLLEVV
jgi:hypothetical protein